MASGGKKGRIAWHPAFYSAMELELRANKEQLSFDREHQLSKEPLRIDLLVVEKQEDVVIYNEIGHIFRRYNIIEYKSPADSLQMDDYLKVAAYVLLYTSESEKAGGRDISDMTMTLVREKKPVKLMNELKKHHARISSTTPGIYLVENSPLQVPTQIIVSGELSPENHSILRVLSNHAKQEDVLAMMKEFQKLFEQGDKLNAESVINVSFDANRQLFENIRGEGKMSDALRYLLREDFDEADRKLAEANKRAEDEKKKAEAEKKKAEAEKKKADAANKKADAATKNMLTGFVRSVKVLMDSCGLDFKHAADTVEIPAEYISTVEAML